MFIYIYFNSCYIKISDIALSFFIYTYILSDFIPNYFQDMRDPLGRNTGNASIGNEL